MRKLPEFTKVSDIRLGRDADFDAWLYNMMTDNNIAYHMNPELIATPEQMRFMVALEDDQVYLPCSDDTVKLLMERDSAELGRQYNRAWRIVRRLVYAVCSDKKHRDRALRFCSHRFRQSVRQRTLIPQRLVKRMTNMLFSLIDDDDPWTEQRCEANAKARQLLDDPVVRRLLEMPPAECMCAAIPEIRRELNYLELSRLMYLSMQARSWLNETPSHQSMAQELAKAPALSAPLRGICGPEAEYAGQTILFLSDAEGGTVFDLAMLFRIMRMGHKVIFAVKNGFYFYSPTIHDTETDPVLKKLIGRACIIHDKHLSKNKLLQLLQENRLLIINDGTRERLNLYRTSVSFARAWKEADLIIAKGWRNKDVLLDSSHGFSRDILCYWNDPADGGYRMQIKARADGLHKFSDVYLKNKAEGIVEDMRRARKNGRTVMFYSCIVGSIPGQTNTAIQLVNAFVGHLREKMDGVFIVNPTEQFEVGMDGDDLMYMWEKVQRSNLIDIWRFQTVEDIEQSFALLERKITPAWSGKDSTFSTGCTKEMHIALEMVHENKELQIIGPPPEKFFRRGQYGVGKYFDAKLKDQA
ncbi:MAG: protein-glutamate O-methyltransferase family protein [Deltaproteobacteria bacterium]|jgi:uncharacterized protein with ATP-grasp and redox domains|nr:protein-glutamate O-methyltransferase family protein [Deltaproteobacteria bacterium]